MNDKLRQSLSSVVENTGPKEHFIIASLVMNAVLVLFTLHTVIVGESTARDAVITNRELLASEITDVRKDIESLRTSTQEISLSIMAMSKILPDGVKDRIFRTEMERWVQDWNEIHPGIDAPEIPRLFDLVVDPPTIIVPQSSDKTY